MFLETPTTPSNAGPWWAVPLGTVVIALLGGIGIKIGGNKSDPDLNEKTKHEERLKKIEDRLEKHADTLAAHEAMLTELASIRTDIRAVRDWTLQNGAKY